MKLACFIPKLLKVFKASKNRQHCAADLEENIYRHYESLKSQVFEDVSFRTSKRAIKNTVTKYLAIIPVII